MFPYNNRIGRILYVFLYVNLATLTFSTRRSIHKLNLRGFAVNMVGISVVLKKRIAVPWMKVPDTTLCVFFWGLFCKL